MSVELKGNWFDNKDWKTLLKIVDKEYQSIVKEKVKNCYYCAFDAFSNFSYEKEKLKLCKMSQFFESKYGIFDGIINIIAQYSHVTYAMINNSVHVHFSYKAIFPNKNCLRKIYFNHDKRKQANFTTEYFKGKIGEVVYMFENMHPDAILCAEGWLGYAEKRIDVMLYYPKLDVYCLATFSGVTLIIE